MQEQLTGKYRFRVKSKGLFFLSQVVTLQVQCKKGTVEYRGVPLAHTYWRDAKDVDLLELFLLKEAK